MDAPGAPPRIPDAIVINKIIQEYMVVSSRLRNAEIEAFANSANRTDVLMMEVFKGLIAKAKA
ncbi:MAG: hypothetical protein HY795_07995 [Desulfovibrio sp.]|nr:hypothetical protein [Desulfovibrio sp.]MBI4959399.1 hypothetical protein [Desulfovibrio sp.]